MVKKTLNLEEVKKFLKKKGFVISKKTSSNFFNKDLKSFYYTGLSSLGIILFFFMLPLYVNF